MHLVGYFYETYHDARSPEHKIFPHRLLRWLWLQWNSFPP